MLERKRKEIKERKTDEKRLKRDGVTEREIKKGEREREKVRERERE